MDAFDMGRTFNCGIGIVAVAAPADAEEAIRLLAAGGEIAHAPECEYVIINQEFSVALAELVQIICAARLRFASQAARHAELFAQLGIPPTH
jgi:guanylate kinase